MHLFHLIERFKPIHMALVQVRGGRRSFILVVVLCKKTKYQRVRKTEAFLSCQVSILLVSLYVC